MAKNFVQHGKTVTCVAPTGGVVNGMIYRINNLVVVADHDAAEGENFEGHTVGVWDFNIGASAVTITPGQPAYLAANGASLTNASATGLFRVGVFLTDKANGSTACRVRLDGVSVRAV